MSAITRFRRRLAAEAVLFAHQKAVALNNAEDRDPGGLRRTMTREARRFILGRLLGTG